MIFSKQDLEAKNKDLGDIEDIPRTKVEREDGLPTVDDMAELMGKKAQKKAVGSTGENDEKEHSECDKSMEDLSDFIEVIIRIPKSVAK